MMSRVINYFRFQQALQRTNVALSRAAAIKTSLNIDPCLPTSWEFSGFSQNGEDGIIEFLLTRLKKKNKQFVEIGSADGLENNSAWLAIGHKYSGVMIEGDPNLSAYSARVMARLNMGVSCHALFVEQSTVDQVLQLCITLEPDFFSIDIDGNDFYITEWLLQAGLKPKILCVEYNSAFGPERALTVSYSNQDFLNSHPTGLYYGVSIAAWRTLLSAWGYHFMGVESRGVNGFFVHPDYFDSEFLANIKPLTFEENFYQLKKFNHTWPEQFNRIQDLSYKEVA